MRVDKQDQKILARMVEEYPINDVIIALEKAIQDRSDSLIDLQLNDQAKELTLAAWHLHIFEGQK